ncbi:glycosyltransferase family 2 protein [Agaribacterium haliotis]|uniref:glycosyltransferase family 2 protein n=1 Tax=Agaribacterium haliotis TaxID=2013869 RepID=UPI000BB55873|nr:glycosyltransferase family 2 protein [Agaribacterium haliotis]
MKISVIFTTYNSPAWLEKVLWGFSCQTDKDFEVLVADDGSGDETRAVIERFQQSGEFSLKHIWHKDEGFKKCEILNKAIIASSGDYIIMTDGDCIPRKDFVAVHRQHAQPGHFLSGGYFKLPMGTSRQINREDIQSGRCFNKSWLLKNGVKNSHKLMKLSAGPLRASLFNALTPTKRTWNGHNASCFKSDMLKVNGFDERMGYGGQDVEFGLRLKNLGLKAKQIRYSAIVIHLDHKRGYATQESIEANRKMRAHTIEAKVISTPVGISQRLEIDSKNRV